MNEVLEAVTDSDVQLDAAVNTEADTTADNEQEKESQKTGNPKVDDPWPKSARNALSRRDKQIGGMRAENAALLKRLEAIEAAQNKASEPKEPTEDDFDSYGEYLKAVARFASTQPQQGKEQPDLSKIQEQARQQAMQEIQYNQRIEAVSQQAAKAVQDVPELATLLQEYSDVLDTFPPSIEEAFLSAENPPMAFYALAKEGKLEQLAQMNPIQAAYAIAQAQIRGEQMAQKSRVSNAPNPIKGARGSSTGGKTGETMSIDDLMQLVKR